MLAVDTVLEHRYRIVRLLGQGGMGEVYLAQDTKLDRKVALKVLPIRLTENKERLMRFEQEARAVSSLNHPHILTIHEFGESEDGTHFIVTEYVEGETLNEHGSGQEPGLTEVLDIAMQVASGLSAAHEAGIAHRDIKPENIMVRKDGYIKVLDFGLAKLTEQKTASDTDSEAPTKALVDTSPGSVMGTAAYMSPEQARGVKVDTRTDIWSLGFVLYEMLTGQKPFKGETSTDTIVSVVNKEPPPITAYKDDLPPELEWIVSKTLSKELDGRYQTAKELRADLAKIKKRVENEDEIERSTTPDRDPEEENSESPTMIHEQVPTAAGKADPTHATTDQPSSSGATQSSSSLEYAVTQAKSHKLLSVLTVIFLLGAISAIGYFAFFPGGRNDPIESIAVMPFVNESGNKDVEYLSDGMTETLISSLTNIPGLSTKASSTVFFYKGKILPQKLSGRN